jgi:hypothetical protein
VAFHLEIPRNRITPSNVGDLGTAVAPCIAMADRRRDKRLRLSEPAVGALTAFPDVVVQQGADDEWIGITRQPAVAGEMLVLDVLQSDAVEGEIWRRLPVCVIESRPVIVDGDMRHRIRLHGGITASVRFDQQVRRG